MEDPIQDMPNQRPNFIGSGLSGLAQFFSDSRVDQGKLQTVAAVLTKRGVSSAQMQRIVTTAMEECDRFPTLAWMLKLVQKRKSDGEGWGDDAPHCTGELDRETSPSERAWLSMRNNELWQIRRALDAGRDPDTLLDRWRLYVDHNRYLRSAPNGELVVTRFTSRAQLQAEIGRVSA